MNPFQKIGQMQRFMQNPMSAVQNQMLQKMQRQNPQMFQNVQQMISGKSEAQLKTMAENIAKDRGLNLNEVAGQFGIRL